MSGELHEQIYKELDLRETDDLLKIWKTNDRVEWSDIAFDAIEEILEKRIGEVPPQDEPIRKHVETSQEDWEEKLLEADNQPELYDPLEVLSLKDKIDKISIAVVVVYISLGILNFQVVRMSLQGVALSAPEFMRHLPSMIVTILSVSLQILVLYFPLKALSHILRILMEMEFNSRKAK